MEVLVFALVAVTKLYRREEKFGHEPLQFQPFDVQALKQVYNLRAESSNRASGRQKSYAIQAVS
jgi:hypothetical protein